MNDQTALALVLMPSSAVFADAQCPECNGLGMYETTPCRTIDETDGRWYTTDEWWCVSCECIGAQGGAPIRHVDAAASDTCDEANSVPLHRPLAVAGRPDIRVAPWEGP